MAPTSEPALTRARALFGLILAVAFGAWVRSVGMDALLPQMVEPDAVYVRQALELRASRAGRSTHVASLPQFYPLLLPWLLSWLPIDAPAPAPEAPLAVHLAAAAAPFLWGRRLVALLSLGLVPATYLMARAVLSRGAALLASAFAGASLVHVLYAQQARPHGAFVALTALALAAALHLRRSGTNAAHLAAGGASALGLSCLHSGVFLLPALGVAVWRSPGRTAGKAALALAPVALVAPLTYPSLLRSTRLEAGGALEFMGHVLRLDSFGGRGFVVAPWLAWSHEPVLTALVGTALLVALARGLQGKSLVAREKRDDLLVLAAFGLPFSLVVGAFDLAWEKYTLPLLPLACLFGAAAAERVAHWMRASRGVRVAGSVALLALPGIASARFALLRARPDSAQRAAAWIESHLDRDGDTVLLGSSLSLPLLRRPPESDPVPDWALSPWDLYQRRRPRLAARSDAWRLQHLYVPSLGERPGRAVLARDALVDALRASRAGWVVLERRGAWQAPDDETRAAVASLGGRLETSFEPYDPEVVTLDSRGWVLGDQAVLRALTADYGGPRIEVWRLDGER